VEGVVDLLPNGSGFVRVNPPEPSDEDVYISSAQVKRCELVPGDHVSGPRRPPRRSERFASLSRVDTINGRPASEVAGGVRFEELPAAFARARFTFDGDDPLLAALDSVAPVGRGSRVTIVGPSQSGKSSLLRRLAEQLARQDELKVWLVLTGIRPEEVSEWRSGSLEPAVALALGASADAQGQAVDAVIEQARRIVARGAHGAVLIDTIDSLPPHVAAKALGSARNVVDSGTLTVIATASLPHGGESTVVALGRGADGSPTIDRDASWTMRADLFAG
jgi:transcription termination factor Rho